MSRKSTVLHSSYGTIPDDTMLFPTTPQAARLGGLAGWYFTCAFDDTYTSIPYGYSTELLSERWANVGVSGSHFVIPSIYKIESAERRVIDNFISIRPVVATFLNHFWCEVSNLYNEVNIELSLFVDTEAPSEELTATIKFKNASIDELMANEDVLFEKLSGLYWFDSALKFLIIEYAGY